jgi:hypothetical protein
LSEQLQRDYRIMIAGPTNLAALLTSFQMGFRSLALQKRSSEVWQLLGAIKGEFDKYGDVVGSLARQLNAASNSVDGTVTVRDSWATHRVRIAGLVFGQPPARLADKSTAKYNPKYNWPSESRIMMGMPARSLSGGIYGTLRHKKEPQGRLRAWGSSECVASVGF